MIWRCSWRTSGGRRYAPPIAFPPAVAPGAHDDPVRFVQAVDRRLYCTKHLGRNRMVDSGT